MKILLLFFLVLSSPLKADTPALIIGWIEKIAIMRVQSDEKPFILKAKIDTGATTSSINAEILAMPEEEKPKKKKKAKKDTKKEGAADYPPLPPEKNSVPPLRDTIIFSLSNAEGEKKVLERKLERWVRIKKKTGGSIKRPVVKLEFCIAGRLVKEEVNLADREHFTYDVLVGRNMLEKGRYLVDSSAKFAGKPQCVVDISSLFIQ